MNPAKVSRDRLQHLEDLPNIGPAMARDLRSLGIQIPADLTGQDAYVLYGRLCALSGFRQDPCVIDVFLSVVHFMDGDAAKSWWAYTPERKQALAALSSSGSVGD
jgi:hypothetical protein